MTFRDTLPTPLRQEQWLPVRTVSLTTLMPDGLARSHSIWRCPAKRLTADAVGTCGPLPPGTLPPQTPCPSCGAMMTGACQRCAAGEALG